MIHGFAGASLNAGGWQYQQIIDGQRTKLRECTLGVGIMVSRFLAVFGCALVCGFFFVSCKELEDAEAVYKSLAQEMSVYHEQDINHQSPASDFNFTFQADDKYINLKDQFTPREYNQGSLGSCFTFSSMAIIEAGIYRQYGIIVKLSEQWVLRLKIAEELVKTFETRNSPAVYLGMSAQDILWWSRRAGICTAKALPYKGNRLRRFDLMYRTSELDAERYMRDLISFGENLKTIDDPIFDECKKEHSEYQALVTPFKMIFLSRMDSVEISRYLKLGIPVQFDASGEEALTELRAPAGHSIVIIGARFDDQKFIIRNSWAGNLPLRMLSFKAVDSNMVKARSFMFGARAVITPSDIARLCPMADQLPLDLKETCLGLN